MKPISTFFSLALAVLFQPPISDGAEQWSRQGSKNGVTVYTKTVQGSDVPMVKAVTTVNATPDRVWQAIRTGTANVSGLKERRQVGTCGQGCEYVYVRMGNPFITDRHYIIKVQTGEATADGGPRFTRHWEKANRATPQTSGSVLDVRHIRGSWYAEPLEGGTKTRLIHVNHMDLGGSIPATLFTSGFVDKTFEIVYKIKQEA